MARSVKRSTARPMTLQPIQHASICPAPMPMLVKPNSDSRAAPKSDAAVNANKSEAAKASRQRALKLQRAALERTK